MPVDPNTALPISGVPAQNQAPQMVLDEDDETFNLGEILATLLEYKWVILALTSLALMLGAFKLFNATPVYRANAMLQIEGGKGTTALQELQPLLNSNFDQYTAINAQLQILKSRMILGRVVDKLKLDIVAQPVYLPYIGSGMARRHAGPDLAQPLFGLGQYAWGGEIIRVDSLEVPGAWLGKTFTLVAGDKGRYQLLDAEQAPVLQGTVGEPATGKGISLFVSQLKARPGTRFTLARISQKDAIGSLQGEFDVKERKDSGVVDATLTGTDMASLTVVLDEILNAYIRQNVEYRSAEAESTLKFLETQLPTLKAQLDAAETAYNDYRQSRGSVDLTLETQSVLTSLVEVDKEAVKLQQERDELRQRFTQDHPTIQAMDAKLERLKSQRGQFSAKVSRLPDTQQTVLRLTRDLEVSSKLYTELLNSAQQLRVSKAGTIGDARVIDQAVLEDGRVSPNSARMLGISLLLGLVLSFLVIWLRRALRVVVEDPDKIEKQLGLPVYATIPHSKAEVSLSRLLKSGKTRGELLALSQPEDDAVESLRSLRTTIHFALLDAARGSLLITGPSQDIGKSFISKNLGAVLAQSGKRVIIVDADLRKGHIHREFGLEREKGVSEFVSGEAGIDDILKPTPVPGLTVITTGQRPPNPSELLMHQRFEALLEELGRRYDTVIVDAPPILAVSDAAIIGRLAGATLLVARAGQHPIRELEQAVKRLNQAGVKVKGFVFNDMDTTRQRYRYGYKGYVYSYRYNKA
jgi:tyrosine-protein kinase Etk/Wzc